AVPAGIPVDASLLQGSLSLGQPRQADHRCAPRIGHLEAHRSGPDRVPATGRAPPGRRGAGFGAGQDGIAQPVLQASHGPGDGDGAMKLSDKLAALEAAERASLRREVEPAVPVAKGNGSHATPAPEKQTKAQNKWSDAKRKVRDLVLAEIGPKLSGPKALKGPSLEKEVKACLDRILRREEVRISPIERQRFLAEVMSDTL